VRSIFFFIIDFEANKAEVAYNGPGKPVRARLPTGAWSGTKRVRLRQIRELAAAAKPTQMRRLRVMRTRAKSGVRLKAA
jgi:hypothetical protein